MTFSLTYQLTGTGWAKCTVTSGENHCEITASYLSDSLRNLVLAAAAISSGFRTVAFCFDEEPGEFRWVLDEVELDQVSLAIYEFRELWANRPNAEGRVLFQATVTPTDFGRAVFDAAQLVLKTHGVAGYAELWAMHPFPTVPLTVLGDILSSADHAA